MNHVFSRNEHEVKTAVQVPRTTGVLLEDEVRRKGTTNRIDDAWRVAIRRRMDEMGISQAELVRLTGASKGHISDALNLEKNKQTSRWVDAIHDALGLPRPTANAVAVVTPASPTGDSTATPHIARELAKHAGAIAALGPEGKRQLAKQIVDGLSDDGINDLLVELLDLRLRR